MKSDSCPIEAPLLPPQTRDRSLSLTQWLLVLVTVMALASASALWLAVREARSLARPNQYSNVWYMANINSELARLSLTAHEVTRGGASTDDLRVRLDVLYSLLDQSPDAPSVNVQLHDAQNATVQTLDDLTRRVDAWTHAIGTAGAASPLALSTLLAESAALRERVQRALVDVHQASMEQTDEGRAALHRSFLIFSAVFAGLLMGTAAGIRRLLQDRRLALQSSRALTEVNQVLEHRVASRTRQIEEARNLLTFILDASPSDVVLIDAQSGKVHFINQRLLARLGRREVPERLFLSDLLLDPKVGEGLVREIDETGQVDGLEAMISASTPYWSSLSARLIDVEGQLAHLMWGFDITLHRKLEDELRALATTDPLSGLNNRRAFMEKAGALLEHCRRYQQPCGLLMLDIDHFKAINDRHGHAVGDTAIQATAQAILQALRDADVVGRVGGEEFAVLLPRADASGVLDSAERIRQAIEAVCIPLADGQALRFTASLGVASFVSAQQTLDQLMLQADQALYQAKAAGRNCVTVLDTDWQESPSLLLNPT